MKVDEWFKNSVRFTLIGAADIDGFIDGACQTYLRNNISDEGAAGTVTKQVFENWVEQYLCPYLGDYSKGESRSVVLLDNASTHNSDRVVQMIEATGARIIYSAPFSPDLNPIENYFSVYKRYLKKNCDDMLNDWESVHRRALRCVDRDMGIRYFRRCGIISANNILTSEEEKKFVENVSVMFVTIVLMI